MRKAFGLVEILIVLIIILVVYFTCFHPKNGRSNPFEEVTEVKTKQEIVNKNVKELEDTKAIRDKIEQNLMREKY